MPVLAASSSWVKPAAWRAAFSRRPSSFCTFAADGAGFRTRRGHCVFRAMSITDSGRCETFHAPAKVVELAHALATAPRSKEFFSPAK